MAARRGRNPPQADRRRRRAKTLVAIWHLLKGHPNGALESLVRLQTNLRKLANDFGLAQIEALGYPSKTASIEEKFYLLQSYP